MCIPKHYIKPQPLPRQILSQAIDLDMGLASKPGSTDYKGAATCKAFHPRFQPHASHIWLLVIS